MRGRKGSSRSTIKHRASQLSQFFKWLVQQEGYRQMNHSIAAYFELSRRDAAEAIKPPARAAPTIADLQQVVAAMPSGDLVARRDRAIVAASCVFGTRADATASLLLGDVDTSRRRVSQDATRVRIKNSKSQVTAWFPLGEVLEQIVTDWVCELRALGVLDSDALFPRDADLETPRLLARLERDPLAPWSTEDGVRRAFKRGCEAAGVTYVNPHAVRHALAAASSDVCRSPEEEQAWSHNLGHNDVKTTRTHYAKMTDDRRDDIFANIGQRDPTPEDVKDLLLRYHEHEVPHGTPEFEKAQRLSIERMERKIRM